MNNQDFSSLTLTAVHAALKAGEILRRGFGTLYEIMAKPGRQNFVTEFDKTAEETIISFIQNVFPLHNFLAEESGYTDQSDHSILWIIDPLDGTRNFAHHIPCFTISIAAYEHEVGLCGVIYQPITNELFVAERGKGAFLNGNRLKVSDVDVLENALIITELPYDNILEPHSTLELLLQLNQKGVTVRNLGSSALSLAYVAAGKVDAFWKHKLYPWDLAAGKIIVEEAGGVVTRYDDQKDFFHTPSSVVVSNKQIHQTLLEKFIF